MVNKSSKVCNGKEMIRKADLGKQGERQEADEF